MEQSATARKGHDNEHTGSGTAGIAVSSQAIDQSPVEDDGQRSLLSVGLCDDLREASRKHTDGATFDTLREKWVELFYDIALKLNKKTLGRFALGKYKVCEWPTPKELETIHNKVISFMKGLDHDKVMQLEYDFPTATWDTPNEDSYERFVHYVSRCLKRQKIDEIRHDIVEVKAMRQLRDDAAAGTTYKSGSVEQPVVVHTGTPAAIVEAREQLALLGNEAPEQLLRGIGFTGKEVEEKIGVKSSAQTKRRQRQRTKQAAA